MNMGFKTAALASNPLTVELEEDQTESIFPDLQ